MVAQVADRAWFISVVSEENQVWPLTQFFLFLFCEKFIDLPSGKSMTPHPGKHYSPHVLPATPSSPSRALLPELQRTKDTVRCAALGAEVPGHGQQQLTQNLDCVFVENALIYTDPHL